MTDDLPDADAQFREWMRENLQRAAAHFGLILEGEPRLGWIDRSIGALASRGEEQVWLRVVSENKRWIDGNFWAGNLDANVFTGLAKPRVLDVYEWEEHRQGQRSRKWPHRDLSGLVRPPLLAGLAESEIGS